jgi:hypothetical protein
MSSSSKTPLASTTKAAAKKTPGQAPSKPLPKPSTEPSLRFHHARALRAKTDAVLAALEAGPEQPRQGEAMADLVHELVDAGMEYYFLRALKAAQLGFVAEQSARLGMSGAVRMISSVSRQFILRMDRPQLLVVARHIRGLY